MKKENTKKPFITVKEAIVAVAVIMLTVVAFGDLEILTTKKIARHVLAQEVEEFSKQLKYVSAAQVIASTKPEDEKPTLIVFYASWCSYCKKLLPNIFALKDGGKIDNTHILFISTDKNKDKLAKYLLKYDYNTLFTPYIIESKEREILKKIIKSKGGTFAEIIPYSLFFDGKGNLINEVRGMMNKKQISNNLREASKQSAME